MRSLFGLLIAVSLVTSCTRSNPELVTLSQQDLSPPIGTGGNGGGGAAGGGGAGGGVAGSGGGTTTPDDLAVAHDLAIAVDMSGPTTGAKCGATTCSTKDACCVNQTGDSCIDPQTSCGNGGSTYACDGPEDCVSNAGSGSAVCCGTGTGTTAGAKGATCSSLLVDPMCVPLCHVFADCPTVSFGTAYIACCAIPNSAYDRCSRTACK